MRNELPKSTPLQLKSYSIANAIAKALNVVNEKQIGSNGYNNGHAGNVKMQISAIMRQLLISSVSLIMV